MYLLAFISFLCLIPGIQLYGASSPKTPMFATEIEYIESNVFPRISAPVKIFSKEVVPLLTKDDFSVTEDGVKIEEFEVFLDQRPTYVVLILDRSGSMVKDMKALKRAAFRFLKIVQKTAICQLVTFSDEITAHGTFTNDTNDLLPFIKKMKPYGATALYDAINRGIKKAAYYPQNLRRIVITFTDGVDQNATNTGQLSRLSAKDIVKKAKAENVPLYFIGLGKSVNKRLMSKMAKFTGGQFLHSVNRRELAKVFTDMARKLDQIYYLQYTTPNPKTDGSWRKVSITSTKSGKDGQGKGKYQAPQHVVNGKSKLYRWTYTPQFLDHVYLEDISHKFVNDSHTETIIAKEITAINEKLEIIVNETNRKLEPVLREYSILTQEDPANDKLTISKLSILRTKASEILEETNNTMIGELDLVMETMRPIMNNWAKNTDFYAKRFLYGYHTYGPQRKFHKQRFEILDRLWCFAFSMNHNHPDPRLQPNHSDPRSQPKVSKTTTPEQE